MVQLYCWLSKMMLVASVVGLLCLAVSAEARAESPADVFESDVAKVLIVNCVACHNASETEGHLDLTSHETLLAGGESGPTIVPGSVGESYLLDRIRDGEMPPEEHGSPLTADQLSRLEQWVRRGAPWPEGRILDLYEFSTGTRAGRDWWSWQPLKRPVVPHVAANNRVRNPIDAFVLQRLEEHGLSLSPEADRVTLIRRVTFDLIGMPPTPDEIDEFVNDTSDIAYATVVNRLLESQHYGERWGRHWLDLVRYADTGGYETDHLRPTAYHYRDYVINALNLDVPYDQFIVEQLAGDAVGARNATGFLVCAAFDDVTFRTRNEIQRMQVRQDELHEFVNTTTQTFLGLAVACSRCHDHKFDPVSQRDYYALQAVFDGIRHPERTITHFPFVDEMKVKRTLEESKRLLAELEAEIKTLPPAPQSERRMKVRSVILALRAKLNGENLDGLPYAVFTDTPDEPTYRLQRGEVTQRREMVEPAVIKSLGRALKLSHDTPEHERRLALAHWIADAENPLTARVMVNRIWQWHFGVGLVDTPSNFGGQGSRPTHPELLDWLASEFIDQGWSVKSLHRLIVNSSSYCQVSSAHNAKARDVDADNRLLWRFESRRLEAEAIRDSMLAVSGKLNLRRGGPGYKSLNKGRFRTYSPNEQFGEDQWRRMVYESRVRIETDPTFGVLDCPDAGQLCPTRRRSTTAVQALNLFNSKFVNGQAEFFASRLQSEAGDDSAAQLRRGFHLAYGRLPSAAQLASLEPVVREHGLDTICRAILNSNEFLFMP